MTIAPEVLDALLAAGASAEMIVAAVKADAANDLARLQQKRTDDASRQRRSRTNRAMSQDVTVTPRDTCDAPPPNDIYSNPPPLSPDASHPPRGRARQAGAFPKPDWADGQVWSDFLANRKTKRLPNTATAHRKLLADIERIADAAWPPGRLLSVATGKGWGAIYPSIKTLDDENRNGQRNQHDRSGGWAPRPGMEGVEPASLDDDDPRYSARH
jgi:hypothetical protein